MNGTIDDKTFLKRKRQKKSQVVYFSFWLGPIGTHVVDMDHSRVVSSQWDQAKESRR